MKTTQKLPTLFTAGFFLLAGAFISHNAPAELKNIFISPAEAGVYTAPIYTAPTVVRHDAAHEAFLRTVEKQYAGKFDPKVIRAANEIMLNMAADKARIMAARTAPQPTGFGKLLRHVSHAAANLTGSNDAPVYVASATPPRS